MGMASQLVFALDGAGLTGQVAVVTDGQLSGLVNKGIVVGEVSPEAAAGGPLALVRSGDRIRIDVLARTADLDVPDAELDRRRAGLAAPPPGGTGPREKGWLRIYQRLVRPLPEGAVLTEPGVPTRDVLRDDRNRKLSITGRPGVSRSELGWSGPGL
jgi:dihydroxy-acid dehydratase